MFESTSFGKTTGILQRGMDVAMLRRDVIANNIANADVPNFKRSTVNFESSLKQALDSEHERPLLEMERTDPRHLSNWQPMDWRSVEPRRVLDYLTTTKNNGNNVDPEQEMMDSLKNQLEYTLMVQADSYEFNQVNSVLR
ncbi:MAG TPA: flagellar basal body rod protein FlgB [Rectinemataceae bacterium]|nr:flagellar basal body rod protein FlgB [Rectinemataceae bacterium]